MTYRLSPAAEQDLEEIWLYVAEEASEDTADRIVLSITTRFVMLARHPKIGRLCQDLADDLRCFPVDKHVIYYREQDGRVVIARILHGSGDQGRLFATEDVDGQI